MNIPALALILLGSIVAGGLTYWLAFLLIRRRSSLISNWSRAFSPRRADALLVALVSVYAVTFGTQSVLSYLSFGIVGGDLGIFDQVVWNSLRGRLFENTILADAPLLIGQRFSPILMAFVPLYAVWSSPIVLLVVQTLGIALGAFPLYWMARQKIGRPLSLVVVVSYLLFPALQYVNLFEFHEISLSVPLLAYATFFLVRRKYVPLLVCLGLTLLVKEEMAFVVSAFGLYLLLVQRQLKLGLGLTLFGVIWAFMLLQYVLPFFHGSEGYYYFSHSNLGGAQERYGYLGKSLPEIVTTLITRPLYVAEHVLILPKIEFTLLLLAPLALIPLLSPEIMMLTLPTFGFSLLSDFDLIYSIRYHYTASLLPFLFFAAVLGIDRILKWRNRSEIDRQARGVAVGVLLLTSSVSSYYFQSPGPLARNFDPARYAVSAHTAIGDALFQTIPADSSVAVQSGLVPHVTEHRSVHEFPVIQFLWQAEYLVADTTQPWYQTFKSVWEEWLATGYFQVVAQPDGYLLAKRIAPAQHLQIGFGDELMLNRVATVTKPTLRGGQPIYIPVEWYALRNIAKRYIVEAHLVDGQGHIAARDEREPCFAFCPTNRWNFDQHIDDYYILSVPPTLASGEYKVTMAVYDPATNRYLSASDAMHGPLGNTVVIGQVHVDKDKSSVTASQLQIEHPLFVDMREMRFLGSTPISQTISAGDLLQLGLYWRARSKPAGDYLAVVQLRDASGRVAFEESSRPANGTYPTTEWDAGEVLLDWHDLTLPGDLAGGSYQIVVLLRDVASNASLGETLIASISVAN